MELDKIDKKLLDCIQADLPVVPEPYGMIAQRLGISEEEVITRLQKLLDRGVIRRLGAVFDSRKVGYTGTLCAMEVPEGRMDEVASIVNAYPGITHNYVREHRYNMWFTLLAPGREAIEKILAQIKKDTGIQSLIELPAEEIFKIRVKFDLSEGL